MFSAGVNFEFAVEGATEAIVWNHSTHGTFNEEFGTALASGPECFGFVTAHVTGKAHIGFGYFLLAADSDFGSIDDDDKIAGVNVWGENGLVLSAKQIGGLDGDTAERLASGVNDPPVALHLFGFG